MQAKGVVEKVAADLGLELRGKSQEELWDEIVTCIADRKGAVSRELPARRRESPHFRWAAKRVPV